MRLFFGLIAAAAVLALPASASAIAIVAAPAAVTNQTSATFTFQVEEFEMPFTSFECRIDATVVPNCTTPYTHSTALGAGNHEFTVTGLRNGVADPTSAAHHLWTIDLTPPGASIVAGPSGETTAKSATFDLSSNEAGSTFQCAIDSTTLSPCQSPVTYTGLSVGSHTFRATTTDPAGNVSAQVTRTWTVRADTVPPDTTITAAPPGLNNLAAPSVEFTASEAGTFQCSVNGGPFGTCASPYILAALADGAITFQVRAVDLAENIDPTPATAQWTRDTAAPAPPAVSIGRRTRRARSATATTAVFHTTTQLRAFWDRAPDATASEVQFRSSPAGADIEAGTWTPVPTGAAATQADVTGGTGRTSCVRARSVDAAGNGSAWTVRCTTLPYKATSVTASRFRKRADRRYFAGQYARYSGSGTGRAFLRVRLTPAGTGAEVKRVTLVAMTCRSCGSVRVVVTRDGAQPLDEADVAASRTVSLRSRRTHRARVILALRFDDAFPSLERRYVYVFAAGGPGERRIQGVGVSSL